MRYRPFRVAAAGAAVATLGIGIALTGCSSGPSGPPSAQSVLKADGYTYSQGFTSAIQSAASSQGFLTNVTSMAFGETSDNAQLVLVYGTPAEATAAVADGDVGNAGPGVNVVTNGDVVTGTGPISAWTSGN
jgi:hypothetical protein